MIKNCNPDFLEKMKHAVDQNIQKITRQSENMSISERYNKIINAVHEVCTTFLKPPRRKSQYWFSSEDGQIDELLETRRKARREYLQTNKQESKDSYEKSKSAVRQALRTMENNFWKKKCEEMQHYADRGDTHKLYQEIKHVYGPKQCKLLPQSFLKKDGSLTSSKTETLERLQEYYSELFNRQPILAVEKIDKYLEQIKKPTNWALDVEPCMKELHDVFKSMKNHKSTSQDPIPVEIYKYLKSDLLNKEIYQIVLECWKHG